MTQHTPIQTDLTPEEIAGGWRVHDGGKCPMSSDALFQIMCRDKDISPIGDFTCIIRMADDSWSHTGRASDVVAYRTFSPDRPAPTLSLTWRDRELLFNGYVIGEVYTSERGHRITFMADDWSTAYASEADARAALETAARAWLRLPVASEAVADDKIIARVRQWLQDYDHEAFEQCDPDGPGEHPEAYTQGEFHLDDIRHLLSLLSASPLGIGNGSDADQNIDCAAARQHAPSEAEPVANKMLAVEALSQGESPVAWAIINRITSYRGPLPLPAHYGHGRGWVAR